MGHMDGMDEMFGGVIDKLDDSLGQLKDNRKEALAIIEIHKDSVVEIDSMMVRTLEAKETISALFTTAAPVAVPVLPPISAEVAEELRTPGAILPVTIISAKTTGKPKTFTQVAVQVAKEADIITGRFSDQELSTLFEMVEESTSYKDIAEKLNRTIGSVKDKIQLLRKSGDIKPSGAASKKPEPAPVEVPVDHEPLMLRFSVGDDSKLVELYNEGYSRDHIALTLKKSNRAVGHRIANLIRIGKIDDRSDIDQEPAQALVEEIVPDVEGTDWTLEDQMLLLKGLVQGRALSVIAKQLDRSKHECAVRYKALVSSPSMDHQKTALKAIKAAIAKRDFV